MNTTENFSQSQKTKDMKEINERQKGLIDELKAKFIEMNPKAEAKGNLLNVKALLIESKEDDLELQEVIEFTKAFKAEAKESFLNSLTPLTEDFRALGLYVEILNSSTYPRLIVKNQENEELFSIQLEIKYETKSNSRGYTQKAVSWRYELTTPGSYYTYISLEELIQNKTLLEKIKLNIKSR